MKYSALTAAILISFVSATQAQTIAKWTFETSGAAYNNNVTAASVTGIVPEEGSGTASGVHASSASVWSSPVGNGSAESLSVNTWAVGDYWQFRVSTVGLFDIGLTFDQTSSGTGPRDFQLQYSTDGASFTTFANYSILANSSPVAWGSTTYHPSHTYSFDLSGVAAIENTSEVYFRLVNSSTVSASGATVATGGTSRIDNVTVAVVPEPASIALLGMGIAGLLFARRRQE